jgi:hypothetical protein
MIRAILNALGKFFTCQWNQYTPLGQFLWVLALVAITVDAGIAWEYGSSMSFLHACGFALVAVAFAVLPDVASMEWSKGKKQAAVWIGVACVPLSMVAYQSHIGYGSAIRIGDIQQASVHNAKFDDKRDDAKKLNEKIAFLEQRRTKLDEEMNALVNTEFKSGNQVWKQSVRPSSAAELQGAIDAKTLERDQEAKRGGCKGRCLLRQQELGHLQALQAKAKEIETNEAQHVATLNGLANARNEVEGTAFRSDVATNQTEVFAKLANFVFGGVNAAALNVTAEQREVTNTAIMGAASLAFLILAPILNFAAGRNRKPEVMRAMAHGEEIHPAPRAMTETRKAIEDRYEEIRAGDSPKGNANYFVKVGSTEDALAKLADILRKSNLRAA